MFTHSATEKMTAELSNDRCAIHEPSETEIIEYAKWLGMDLPGDSPFLWIAVEGLKAPLPENWKACQSDKAELYYFNIETGESIWDHPLDNHFKALFQKEKKKPSARTISYGLKNKLSQRQANVNSKTKHRISQALREVFRNQKMESESDLNQCKLNDRKTEKCLSNAAPKNFNLTADKAEIASGHEAASYPTMQNQDFSKGKLVEEVVEVCSSTQPISADDIDNSRNSEKKRKRSCAGSIASDTVREAAKLLDVKGRPGDDLSRTKFENINSLQPSNNAIIHKEYMAIPNERTSTNHDSKDYDEAQKRKKLLNVKICSTLLGDQQKIESNVPVPQNQAVNILENEKIKVLCENEHASETQVNFADKQATCKNPEASPSFHDESNSNHRSPRKLEPSEVKESLVSLSKELREYTSALLKEYEEAYTLFSQKMIKSKSNFAHHMTQQKTAGRHNLHHEVNELKPDKQCIMQAEMEVFLQKMQELRYQNLDDFKRLYEAIGTEVTKNTQDNFVKNNAKNHTEEALPVFKSSICKGCQCELKPCKGDLERGPHIRCGFETLPPGNVVQQCEPISYQEKEKNITDERHEHNDTREISSNDKNLPYTTTAEADLYRLPSSAQRIDLKTIITNVLKEVFSQSHLIASNQVANNAENLSSNFPKQDPSHPSNVSNTAKSFRIKEASFPASFQGQQELIEIERRHIRQAQIFVENQRQSLQKRRVQLKHTRHQWKQDVFAAKKLGIKSSSNKGQLLIKLRALLEEEAQRLSHDESILHDSEMWLLLKQQRLSGLLHQFDEQEINRSISPDSSWNGSLDGAAIIADSLNTPFRPRSKPPEAIFSSFLSYVTRFERAATIPRLSKSLRRIERCLGEVASIVKMQQRYAH